MSSIHVMPIADLRAHDSSTNCWCRPEQDIHDDDVWLHHALDGREDFETAARNPS